MTASPLANQIAQWGDKLRNIAASGLRYSPSIYDLENYQQVQDMALAMLALSSGELPQALEPLRGTVLAQPTPFAAGDATIVDEQGRMLLIRRADNGLWAMPGGALEVGEAPATGVLREALEETGWRCEAQALIGVFDSYQCGTISRHHLYHFQFLCRPLALEQDPPAFVHETLDRQWFAQEELPAEIDPGHVSRIAFGFEFWHNRPPAFYDPPAHTAHDLSKALR